MQRDSLAPVKVDNQHKTAVNCYYFFYFLSLQGVQASSQQCKQTNRLHCWLATSPSTWLAWFANFSLMDTITFPDCQVGWSHSSQTFKSTCTFCWSLCSWINHVDDFFPKNIQKYSMLFRSESCFLRSRKTRKMLWIMLPRFPAGAGTQETGSKRKGKWGKEELLKGKCNQAPLSSIVDCICNAALFTSWWGPTKK